MNIWTYVVNQTGFERHAIKRILFCMVFGSIGEENLFTIARSHNLDICDIAKIRGAADEWLKGEAKE
jgi:hypothetical protein